MCDREDDIYRSFADYQDTPVCCGQPMFRVICAPYVAGDITPYRSMIDGTVIESRSRHREHLRAHGCIEVGNEKLSAKPLSPPPGLKETLIQVANEKIGAKP
jgi:hypothetical protein